MMDYGGFFKIINDTPVKAWKQDLTRLVEKGFNQERWGDMPKWQAAVDRLPDIRPSEIDFKSDVVRIGSRSDCDDSMRQTIKDNLMQLHPWRKGPFEFFGLKVDTEWRSDFKWNRLKEHISDLKDRVVLDVGSGSGYHCWRMLGAGAKCVMGIDPTLLYPFQFAAVQKYAQQPNIAVVPVGIDDMPHNLEAFDTVFSMGLLYHRRAPFDHLLHLKSLLRSGGELVLETLVIEGKEGEVLSPHGRYAKMPNVWFIPTVKGLESWLRRMQFQDVRCVDVSVTTPEEQRATEWMGFESLSTFLDPDDPSKTVEGYPAPRRAIVLAKK